MADISSPAHNSQTGTWQTVEQAAVSLGLSVRTVNRHISAQKLKSRLIDGRREVFVASPDPSEAPYVPPLAAADTVVMPVNGDAKRDEAHEVQPTSTEPKQAASFTHPSHANGGNVPFDFETALARADNAADKAELAVSAYQSLARSIEIQAHSARRLAATAWCIVAILMVGVTIAVGWTATRLTRAESEAEHLKQDADSANKRAELSTEMAARNADTQEQVVTKLREDKSAAEQRASRAEGALEQIQSHQPASRPASRPTLIDRLTTAFGGTGQ